MSDEERPILTKNWELLSTEDWNALDDDEYEDEQVEYLTLDFTQLSAGLTALEAFKQYQLIGLETETPFFSVGSHVFQGQHETLIGDEILLIPEDAEAMKPTYKPFAVTSNRIVFQPVTLTDINDAPSPPKIIKGRTAARKPRASTSKPAEPKTPKPKVVKTRQPKGPQPMEVDENLDDNVPAKGKNILRNEPAKPPRKRKRAPKTKPDEANAVAGSSKAVAEEYTLEDMMKR